MVEAIGSPLAALPPARLGRCARPSGPSPRRSSTTRTCTCAPPYSALAPAHHVPVSAEPQRRSPSGPADLAEALGGAHGLADSSLPGLAFVVAYTISGSDLQTAIVGRVGVAVVLTAVRLARRETLQFAFAGLVGVGIAAFIAERTGRAEDFFLPGLLLNAGYALAYAISIWIAGR